MTINATFQSFSASAMRLTFTERTAAATAPAPPAETVAPAASSGGADRVTLSGAADSGPAASADAPAPEGEPAPASPLFTRLDADQDGTMTKEEFTTGALALLGRRADRSRVHGNGDGDNGRRARGVPGLERRLEKAFDRVDANKDGGIDDGELNAALARVGDDDGAAAPAPPSGQPQAVSSTTTLVSVTYVSVAVQRYSSMQQAAPAESPVTASAPEAPAGDPTPRAAG